MKDDCKEIKNALRQKCKDIRPRLLTDCANKKIVKNIKSLAIYQNARNVMIFYPLKNEIDLRALFAENSKNKNFFLPKTIGEQMFACPFENESELVEGNFKIKEPTSPSCETPEIIDLIIAPALSVDRYGNRLGYGKGYYDRFLNNFKTKKTVLVPLLEGLFDIQKIPTNEFDVKVDLVVTEEKIYELT